MYANMYLKTTYQKKISNLTLINLIRNINQIYNSTLHTFF